MDDSVERLMANIFLMDNNDEDIYKLNRSAMKYFYSLSPSRQNSMDVSYFWDKVLKEWNYKQSLRDIKNGRVTI